MLQTPAPAQIYKLAKAYLKSADRALKRISGKDPEALHDFRVALRKLRSLLSAYGNELPEEIKPQDQKALRKLFRRTGNFRDYQVQKKWLDQHCHAIKPDKAYSDFIQALFTEECLKKQNPSSIYPYLEKTFPPVKKKLLATLAKHKTRTNCRTFADVSAQKIVAAGKDLQKCLNNLINTGDYSTIHDSRIATKTLRYLLEPLSPVATGLTPFIEKLELLQRVLGNMHDLDILRHRLTEVCRQNSDNPPLQHLAKIVLSALEEDYRRQRSALALLLEENANSEFSRDLGNILAEFRQL